MEIRMTSKGIFGKLVDDQGRCEHYHTKLDVIANRCGVCNKLYACYKCHDELEDHPFSPVKQSEPESVMCGVCGTLYSYEEYSNITACKNCGAQFNPRCALHKSCYVS